MVMVNAGANRGWTVIDFLQRFWRGAPDNTAWLRALRANGLSDGGRPGPCGFCGQCKAPRPPLTEAADVRVHAFELLATNARVLGGVANSSMLGGRVHVHHSAVGNATGRVFVPEDFDHFEGRESAEARFSAGVQRTQGTHRRTGRYEHTLRMTTIDSFAAAHRIPVIHQLTVDTEGFDALVLEGAREMLTEHRIKLLEFEYHSAGYWGLVEGSRSLESVLATLDKLGYTCFWQGGRRAPLPLARASGSSWCRQFEFRRNSNLVCAHTPAVVKVLSECADGAASCVGQRR